MVEVIQLDDFKFGKDSFFVNVSSKEALLIIKTLAAQMVSGDNNTNRQEFYKRSKKDAAYFTIAVVDERTCAISHDIDEIWDPTDAEAAIEASKTEETLEDRQ